MDGPQHKLKAEVQRLLSGKRSKGGRKFALPETPDERLRRLAELSQTWLNLLGGVVPAEHAGLADRIAEARSGGRRDAIRASPRKVLEALTEVQARAGEAEETLRGLEETADAARPDDRPHAPRREPGGAGPPRKEKGGGGSSGG